MHARPNHLLLLFAIGAAGLAFGEDGPTDEPPAGVTISQATSAIEIDGRLDEPAWGDAARLQLAYESFPGDGIAPPVQTECLLTYDDDRFYVAFRALDPDPSQIRAHLMDRDSIETFVQDDHVSVMIDTFNDQRRAFQFRVNPLGVQVDGIFSEVDGLEDFSWDIIWKSAGRITEDGYEVELGIPLNQLRFPRTEGVQTWGVDASRSYPRNVRHRISANYRDRNDNCLLCQVSKVTGFQSLEPGLNLELDPTLTITRTDTREPFPAGDLEAGDEDYEPGLTARWGFTSSMTLNGALNPDFSQVEADVAQLDVNERFALFFPEKRPFFLEGVDFFSTPIDAVFTRTVADPEWGIKLTGKEGKNAVGVFAAQDEINNLVFPTNQGSEALSIEEDVLSGVVRYRRDVGKSSTVGALFAGRDGEDYRNSVAGVDGQIKLNKVNDLRFQYLHSSTDYSDAISIDCDDPLFFDAIRCNQPVGSFGGDAWLVDWNRVSREWIVSIEYEDRDENFRADSGFVPRVNFSRVLGVIRRNFWGEPGDWYSQIQTAVLGFRTEDQNGQLTDESIELSANFSGPLQSFAEISFQRNRTFFIDTLYEDLERVQLYFEIQPSRVAKLTLFTDVGDTVDFINNQAADLEQIAPGVELKLGRHLNAKLDHTLQRLDVAAGELFEANLSQLRLVYQFNVRMFARAIVQYRDVASELPDPPPAGDDLYTELLFSYKLNPQTVAFVGYSETQRGDPMVDLTPLERTFFVKLGYAWVR